MVMLRKRKMILALINKLPSLLGRKNGKLNTVNEQMMTELKFLYGQLGLYDRIIDYMTKAGV